MYFLNYLQNIYTVKIGNLISNTGTRFIAHSPSDAWRHVEPVPEIRPGNLFCTGLASSNKSSHQQGTNHFVSRYR